MLYISPLATKDQSLTLGCSMYSDMPPKKHMQSSQERPIPTLWAVHTDAISGSNDSHENTRLEPTPSAQSADMRKPRASCRDDKEIHSERPGGGSQCSVESLQARPGRDTKRSCQDESEQLTEPARTPPSRKTPVALAASQPVHEEKNERPASGDARKARMVWSQNLHREFLHALSVLGLRNAVPKTIMQKMQVSCLTRENVASHLQKYRLSLKRQANLPDNVIVDDSKWPLLEAAHARHVSTLQPPLPDIPTTSTATPCAPAFPSPSPTPEAHPDAPAPKRACTSSPGEVSRLPPLPPFGTSAPASIASPGYPFPSGFSVPPPNAHGQAVGLPLPFHMLQPSKVAQTPSRAHGAACPLPPLRAPGNSSDSPPCPASRREPLALPEDPSSLMPATFQASRMEQHIALATSAAQGPIYPNPWARAANQSDGKTSPGMCTVYMVNPTAMNASRSSSQRVSNPEESSDRKLWANPTQVPHMMLSVSLSAYNANNGSRRARSVVGAPAAANSSGSASPLEVPTCCNDDGTSAPLRAASRSPNGTVPRARSGRGSRVRSSAGVRAHGRRSGSYSGGTGFEALDALAEVAGRLAEGEEL